MEELTLIIWQELCFLDKKNIGLKMIKLPKNVQIEEIPLEAMYRSVLRGLLTRIKILLR